LAVVAWALCASGKVVMAEKRDERGRGKLVVKEMGRYV